VIGMGADSAVRIAIEPAMETRPRVIAASLVGVLRDRDCSLVLCGDESPYDASASVAYHLGALLGWSVAAGVVKMQVGAKCVTAIRRLDKGVRETVELDLPAIVAVHRTIASVRYVSRGALARARLVPVSVRDVDVSLVGSICPLDGTGGTVTNRRPPPADIFVPPLELAAMDRLEQAVSGGVRERARNVMRGTATEVAVRLADFIQGRLEGCK